MIEKSITLFGRQIYSKIERLRDGSIWTTLINGEDFNANSDYLKWYLENPVLSAVVNLRSKVFSQMQITHLDAKGKPIENSEVLKLLKEPNYFQSQEDFLFQLMCFLSISGNNYIYQKRTFSNELPKALYNLIPSNIDFNKVNKLNKFVFTKQDKKAFEERYIKYTLDNKEFDIKLYELTHIYDLANAIKEDSWFCSPSRVTSIEKVIQNIDANLNSKYKNLKFSAKYIGVNKSTGLEAQIQPNDKKAIENVLSSKDVLTTNASVEYKHLVSDLKRLYLDDQFADDANKVLATFEMNKNVINYFAKDSTFENQEKGVIYWIQNSIQGSADNLMNSLSSSLGLLDKNEKLVASYNHLPVMQSLFNEKIRTLTELQSSIASGLANCTINQATANKMTEKLIKDLGL